MAGLRDKILAANDVESELVEVPEWGVSVEVRSMSLAMRERIGQMASEAEDARKSGADVDPGRAIRRPRVSHGRVRGAPRA